MIHQWIFTILLSVTLVALGGPFITKAMTNTIDMQLIMQLQQVEVLRNGN